VTRPVKQESTALDTASIIREAGLRATRGRIAVFESLLNTRTPLNHSQLVDALAHLGLDQATVYRNLMDLTRVGLLRRTDLGDHVWRFELVNHAESNPDHPHFVCLDCGEVQCLPDLDIAIQGKMPTQLPVQIRIEGQCDECA
jgi:Fur family ferric uptake transcriptional regulator